MSNNKCLVVIEVSQKQRYIFSSNRLRENIGASIVVAKMTSEVPKDAFREYINSGNMKYGQVSQQCKDNFDTYFEGCCINNGGGKAIYRFADEEEARTFIKVVSLYILKHYFGIEVFFAKHVEESSDQIKDIEKLYDELGRKKSCRRQSFRLYGIGLNEKCPSTGLPINVVNRDTSEPQEIKDIAMKYRSMIQQDMKKADFEKVDTYGKDGFNLEVYTKLVAAEVQDEFFDKYIPSNCIFPHDMDQLGGKKEEKNRIAVITMDGNGMGKRLREMEAVIQHSNENITYFEALKKFSSYIENVYNEAIKAVVYKIYENREKLGTFLNLYEEDNKSVLPIRPLISAGDDICILTDARIGLDVAEELLRAINQKSKEMRETEVDKNGAWFQEVVNEDGMHASAGVVFCKEKYPFARAYKLAEDIQKQAKMILSKKSNVKDASMLDFYVAMGEIDGEIASERERRDIKRDMDIEKAYVVYEEAEKACYEASDSFTHFKEAVALLHALMEGNLQAEKEKIYQAHGVAYTKKPEKEKVGKSKIKEFAYYLRQGNEVAKNFMSQIPAMQELPELPIGRKEADLSIYLDAIEMLDLYKKIGGEQ